MEMINKHEMEIALQFKLKLLQKDPTIQQEIDFLNSNVISDEVKLLIEESTLNHLLNILNVGDSFFFEHVKKVNILNTNFYIHMADVSRLYSTHISDVEKESIIAEKIDLSVGTFNDVKYSNIFYKYIIGYTLKQDNPVLIKKAIDKIQTFN